MLYHYTSFDALKSILKEPSSNRGMDFWATRFDCFGDKEEYRLGVETIKRLLPLLEERLQPDRRVAASFVWDEIIGNPTLPYPYVVSFTDKKENEYMWKHYSCNGKGVVIELDDSQPVVNEFTKNYFIRKCLYLGETSDEDLYKEIEGEYVNSALAFLSGPQKDMAFALLVGYPQLFVVLVGRYLLSYVAPRIKGNRYLKEEETRVIFAAPRKEMIPMIVQYRDVMKSFQVDVDEYERMMKSEKVRKKDNGKVVYYQDIFMPGSVLKGVYVKNEALAEQVKVLLHEKGFDGVVVEQI